MRELLLVPEGLTPRGLALKGPIIFMIEFFIIKVIDYLCLLLTLACVKMSISWRKYAWVGKNYSTHQRLNKEYLNNNKNNRI